MRSIRVDSYVIVTLRNDSHASVYRSFSERQPIVTIRHEIVSDRLICKLADHVLITCDL